MTWKKLKILALTALILAALLMATAKTPQNSPFFPYMVLIFGAVVVYVWKVADILPAQDIWAYIRTVFDKRKK